MTTRLTHRQWLVWVCWTSGMTYAQIAYSLGIEHGTVHTYLNRIRAKIGVRSAIAASTKDPEHA